MNSKMAELSQRSKVRGPTGLRSCLGSVLLALEPFISQKREGSVFTVPKAALGND